MLDGDLWKVAQFIFERFKKETDNGIYIAFDPQNIFINSAGKVCHEDSGKIKTVDSVSEGLYALGVALYHLATGQSTYNKSNFVYKPFESELWPLLELLLSQSAASLPQVEAMLKPPTAIKKFGDRILTLTAIAMLWLVALIGRGAVMAFQWLRINAGNVYSQTKKAAAKAVKFLKFIKREFTLIMYIALIIVAIASFICLAFVNIIYFGGPMTIGCGLLIITVSIMLGAVSVMILHIITDGTCEDDCIFWGWIIFLILVASLSVYEIFEAPTADIQLNPLVVVDRSSGNLIGRIADANDRNYIPHYEGRCVNLFVRSYAPGIITQREDILVEAPLAEKEDGEKFCFWIKYAITDQATFENDWKRMMKNKQTQADLEQELIVAGQAATIKAMAESDTPIKSRAAIEQELNGITVEAKGADGTLSKNDYQVIREVTVRLVRNELLSRRQTLLVKQRQKIMADIQDRLREQFKDQYNYIEIKESGKLGETLGK